MSFDSFAAEGAPVAARLASAGPDTQSLAPAPAPDTQPAVFQRTLSAPVSVSGVGVHSGRAAKVSLTPAPADSGITFRRTDLPGAPVVPARYDCVADTRMCTVLENETGARVATVEHLMAALAGCGVDNCEIHIDGPEIPIMDGSAQAFVSAIAGAGVTAQSAPRRVIRILEEVSAAEGDASASIAPAESFRVDVEIAYDNDIIGCQRVSLGIVNGAFCKELSDARTYGFLHEVDALRAAGLARGGSLENAIVIDGETVMNAEGLRRADEFVRHKALDAVGDLYLAGAQIIGAFTGRRSGHAVNNKLLRALFARPEAWAYDTLRADEAGLAVDGGISAAA
ncbi:MAG: UDP-3-O-acyl-N-acetylglucosamine deacetylase [Rhodospirillales bacterium]